MLGGLHPNGHHKDNANNAVYSSDGIKIGEVDANIWYKRGNTNQRLGRHDEALKCYDKAVEMNPNYVMAWIKKGLIQEWVDGLKIIEEYPNHEKIGGVMQINQNYVSRAYIKYYDKTIEINNSNYENNAVDVWLLGSYSYLMLQKLAIRIIK
jgi:tetratricopeptide (TPR) repeat protein